MVIAEHSQKIILLWGVGLLIGFSLAWAFLYRMLPPPSPELSPAEIADHYTQYATPIRMGALVASYTSAFLVPFSLVVAFQLARIETGKPVWAVLSFAGGCFFSLFQVLPGVIWGLIAFDAARHPDISWTLNQFANLLLVSTDQYYMFQMVAIAYVGLKANPDPLSAFPRWLCFLNIFVAIVFAVGGPSFFFKHGPFAWDGLIVFWLPTIGFFIWLVATNVCMWRALTRQEAASSTHWEGAS